MKKIIIMSEYKCYPLWESKADGLANFEAYELDIPYKLAERIEGWGDQFESTYNIDDPVSSGFKTEDEKSRFVETGKVLMQELHTALGQDFMIEYRMLDGKKLFS